MSYSDIGTVCHIHLHIHIHIHTAIIIIIIIMPYLLLFRIRQQGGDEEGAEDGEIERIQNQTSNITSL